MASPLHNPDHLATLDPAFSDARDAADGARSALASAESSLADLRTRHAAAEAEADRLAVESVKGRADAADARAKATEADDLAAQIAETEATIETARQRDANATAAMESARAAAVARIEGEKREAYLDLAAEFAGHLVALDRLAKAADDHLRDLRRHEITPPCRELNYRALRLMRANSSHTLDDAGQVLDWLRTQGVDAGHLDGMSRTVPPLAVTPAAPAGAYAV